MKKLILLAMFAVVSIASYSESCLYTNAVCFKNAGEDWGEWQKCIAIYCVDGDNGLITVRAQNNGEYIFKLQMKKAEKYSNDGGEGFIVYCYDLESLDPVTVRTRDYKKDNIEQSQVYFYFKDGIILFDTTL